MKSYTIDDIVRSLRSLGLKKGDTVFSHSNIGFFGQLEGASTAEEYGEAFLSAFLKVIGENGNICVPAFTYSFCKNLPFDPRTTPSDMGIFAEYIRTLPYAERSEDANFSVAVIGKDAKALTENAPEHSFGKDSFWERFLNSNGKICNMNFGTCSTFIHFVEKNLNVPYRYNKTFYGKSLLGGRWVEKQYTHFVRHLDKPEWDTDVAGFDRLARNAGIVSETDLGRGSILAVSTGDIYSFLKYGMAKNPYLITVKGAE